MWPVYYGVAPAGDDVVSATHLLGGVRYVWGASETPTITDSDRLVRVDISGIADAAPLWLVHDTAGVLSSCPGSGAPVSQSWFTSPHDYAARVGQRYVYEMSDFIDCGIPLMAEIEYSETVDGVNFFGDGPPHDEYVFNFAFSEDGGSTWRDQYDPGGLDDPSRGPDAPWDVDPVHSNCFEFPGVWNINTGPYTKTIDFAGILGMEKRQFCTEVNEIRFREEFSIFNAPMAAAFIGALIAAVLGIVRQ
jgi:hypothetical protein